MEGWQARWREGRTRWDQGREHPELARLLEHARREGELTAAARIFSAGCGRAHNEAYLARCGFEVTAVDLVPEAIDEARKLYGMIPQLHLAVQDVCVLGADELHAYGAVFDRAMLCALEPAHRPQYIEAIRERLSERGLFFSILFRSVRTLQGPPFALDETAAFDLMAADFDLAWAGAAADPGEGNVSEEWLCIWRKKQRKDGNERKDP